MHRGRFEPLLSRRHTSPIPSYHYAAANAAARISMFPANPKSTIPLPTRPTRLLNLPRALLIHKREITRPLIRARPLAEPALLARKQNNQDPRREQSRIRHQSRDKRKRRTLRRRRLGVQIKRLQRGVNRRGDYRGVGVGADGILVGFVGGRPRDHAGEDEVEDC